MMHADDSSKKSYNDTEIVHYYTDFNVMCTQFLGQVNWIIS